MANFCLKCGAALPEGMESRGICAKCEAVSEKLGLTVVGVIIFVALLVAWTIWKALHGR